MRLQVKKKGFYFLFSLIVSIALGLALNITGCCLDLSTWVTSSTDTEQQTEATTAEAADSAQASQTVAAETTEVQTVDTAAQDDLSINIKADFDKLVSEGTDTPELFSFLDSNSKDADTGTLTYMVGEMIRISEEKKYDFTDKFTKGKIQEKIFNALG
jgi:hypothetical protein